MSAFELAAGGLLEVIESDGDRVALRCGSAFPPGSTLEFRTSASFQGAVPHTFKVKVRSCRGETPSPVFHIEGRFVSLSRSAREVILSCVPFQNHTKTQRR